MKTLLKSSDPTEQRDLSRRFPKLAKNLADAWEAFAVETRIVTSGGTTR